MFTSLKALMLTGGTLALAALTFPTTAFAASAPPAATSSRTLSVDNARPEPVDVYLDRGEFDVKLGTVGAHSVGVLTIPKYLDVNETAQIVVHPKYGFDLASQDIQVPVQGTLKVLVPDNDTGYLPQPRFTMPGLDPNVATLTVNNPRAQSVRVDIEYGEFNKHLGTVGADQTHTFNLPAWLTREPNDVQIYLTPKKGFDMSSRFFTLKPKAHLEVTVPLNG
ncbi:MAG: hypothetical protein PVJ02_13405 [Gemmatimonadota bacterium]|jgi:hypothetical protein